MKYKVGDKVKVIAKWCWHCHDIWAIVYIIKANGSTYDVSNTKWWEEIRWGSSVNDDHVSISYSIWDKVKILKNIWWHCHDIWDEVYISEISASESSYCTAEYKWWRSATCWWVKDEEIELATEEIVTEEYKVWDKIRILKEEYWHCHNVWDILYIVTNSRKGNTPYATSETKWWDHIVWWYVGNDEIELASEEFNFKLWDRVKIIWNCNCHWHKIWDEITLTWRIVSDDDDWQWRWFSDTRVVREVDIELATEEEPILSMSPKTLYIWFQSQEHYNNIMQHIEEYTSIRWWVWDRPTSNPKYYDDDDLSILIWEDSRLSYSHSPKTKEWFTTIDVSNILLPEEPVKEFKHLCIAFEEWNRKQFLKAVAIVEALWYNDYNEWSDAERNHNLIRTDYEWDYRIIKWDIDDSIDDWFEPIDEDVTEDKPDGKFKIWDHIRVKAWYKYTHRWWVIISYTAGWKYIIELDKSISDYSWWERDETVPTDYVSVLSEDYSIVELEHAELQPKIRLWAKFDVWDKVMLSAGSQYYHNESSSQLGKNIWTITSITKNSAWVYRNKVSWKDTHNSYTDKDLVLSEYANKYEIWDKVKYTYWTKHYEIVHLAPLSSDWFCKIKQTTSWYIYETNISRLELIAKGSTDTKPIVHLYKFNIGDKVITNIDDISEVTSREKWDTQNLYKLKWLGWSYTEDFLSIYEWESETSDTSDTFKVWDIITWVPKNTYWVTTSEAIMRASTVNGKMMTVTITSHDTNKSCVWESYWVMNTGLRFTLIESAKHSEPFKVWDIIVWIERNWYSITDEESTCKVVDVLTDWYMKVEVIKHPSSSNVWDEHRVKNDTTKFNLTTVEIDYIQTTNDPIGLNLSTINVWDLVVMNTNWKDSYSDWSINPYNLTWRITWIYRDQSLPIKVEWTNGKPNAYRFTELDLLSDTDVSRVDYKTDARIDVWALWAGDTWEVKVDWDWTIKEFILNTKPKKTMSTFDKIQMETFFADKKIVKAIEEMKSTLANQRETFWIARRDLDAMENKAEILKEQFDMALRNDEYKTITKLLKDNKALIEYMDVYAENKVITIWTKEVKVKSAEEFFTR
jgi:hypothetical protein